jgi:NAD(P)-dependent dehydrogenase (short-subunit alcohol dehydrogenase family)
MSDADEITTLVHSYARLLDSGDVDGGAALFEHSTWRSLPNGSMLRGTEEVRPAVEKFGRVDAVLNVAGIADGCLLTDLTMEFYDRLMDVDLRGVMLGMKHGIRTMLKTGGGAVVNWSSVGGLNGSAYASVYQAAKRGINGASKSAAIEFGNQGVRVNTICPGFILTEIMAVGAEDFIPDIAAKAALNRAG